MVDRLPRARGARRLSAADVRGWGHRGRLRWRGESGGSARVKRAVGAAVAALRGAERARDLSAWSRETRSGLVRFAERPQ